MLLHPEHIAGLGTASADYERTESLKDRIASLRANRGPFWLSGDELEPIFKWKLDTQYGRQLTVRSRNTDQAYRAVTQAAFLIVGPDPAYELKLRTNLLTTLPGVGIGVASAILAMVEPQSYCVIDFRGWRAAYGEGRRDFTVDQFLRYRVDVSALAKELGWSTQ